MVRLTTGSLTELPLRVITVLSGYAEQVRMEFPQAQIVLFGSCAKGTYTSQSDIDIAVFLPECNDEQDLRLAFRTLCKLSRRYEFDIQPQVFPCSSVAEPVGIFEEIMRDGIDITDIAKHNEFAGIFRGAS